MTDLYVARSQAVQKWGADVGLTQHLYYVGLADDVDAAIKGLNDAVFAGETDWKLAKKKPADGLDAATLLERLSRREKMVDPGLYPKLKGASGIFKVKLASVQTRLLMLSMLHDPEAKTTKPKAADVADYLIQQGLGTADS